ncbi:MAG: DUF1214 domain-containing protein [bacterium]|nr:DUF1214 domain-containing protein [bacterium]
MIKRILIGVVGLLAAAAAAVYLSVFYNPQTAEQETLNASWKEFAREIEALGELVEDAPFNRDDQTAAEGYRHLARFLSTMIATETDRNHPDYPQFTRFPNSVAQIGWNNPDNPYLSFFVRGDHEYVLRGNIAHFDLLTITVYSGMLGYTPMKEMRTVSGITSDDIDADEAGDFELYVSSEPREGNWLELEPDAKQVVIRRLKSDWAHLEEGEWEVLNLTTLGQGSPRPRPQDVQRALRESVARVRGVRSILTMAHRLLFQMKLSPNEVPVPAIGDPALPMSDPFQATSRAWYELEGDEALVITVPDVSCRFRNIQLANPWMEAGDYASHQNSLNHRQFEVDPDGMVRFVISARDPGVPNWLDTAGYPQGSLFGRWTYCDQYPETLTAVVVPFDRIRANLPPTTPTISREERSETITERQRAISRWLAGG